MKVDIKSTKGVLVKVDAYEIYTALAEINNLIEIQPNRWKCPLGNYYTLTKNGFIKLIV